MYHTVFFLREILELKEKQKSSGWGIGEKVKNEGFLCSQASPLPTAAQGIRTRSQGVLLFLVKLQKAMESLY